MHAKKNCMERELSLTGLIEATRDGGVPARDASPSQIVGAEEQFEKMLHNRPSAHQRILTLLRDGMTYREIADHLNTSEKTVQRLVRGMNSEAQLNDRLVSQSR